MWTSSFAPFTLLVSLTFFGISHAAAVQRVTAVDTKGANLDEVKDCYNHVAARYASWATRKKGNKSSYLQYGQLKLAVTQEAPPPVVRSRGTTIPFNSVGEKSKMLGHTFNAEVGMGTPAQLFNLTADTGSTLTWAVQTSCKETDCPGVTQKRTYDSTKSSSSRAMGSDHVAYGDGEMDLELFSDVVTLNTLTIAGTIGGANKTFEKDGKLEHDGLLGLGRQVDAQPEAVLDSLAKQDKHFNEIITLDLGANASMEIGGYDFATYSKLSSFKVVSEEGWMLSGSSLTAEGADPSRAADLLLDTGSSVSMLPSSCMDAIMDRPGLKVLKTKEELIVYSMPCDTKLAVQLMLPDRTKINIADGISWYQATILRCQDV